MTEVPDKKSFFDYIIEIAGWLQIVASPLALSLIIGGFIYFPKPGKTRLIFAGLIVLVGLIIGIRWANNIWRKKGTSNYLATIRSSPDFDNIARPEE